MRCPCCLHRVTTLVACRSSTPDVLRKNQAGEPEPEAHNADQDEDVTQVGNMEKFHLKMKQSLGHKWSVEML